MTNPIDTFKFDTADDFGFSTMEVSTIKSLPEVTGELTNNVVQAIEARHQAEERTRDMFNAIMPLLDNLLKDADKNAYIHWPNRIEKINAFKAKLTDIRDRD